MKLHKICLIALVFAILLTGCETSPLPSVSNEKPSPVSIPSPSPSMDTPLSPEESPTAFLYEDTFTMYNYNDFRFVLGMDGEIVVSFFRNIDDEFDLTTSELQLIYVLLIESLDAIDMYGNFRMAINYEFDDYSYFTMISSDNGTTVIGYKYKEDGTLSDVVYSAPSVIGEMSVEEITGIQEQYSEIFTDYRIFLLDFFTHCSELGYVVDYDIPASNNSTPEANNSSEAISAISVIESNIIVDVMPTIEGGYCLFITNNNERVVDEIEITIVFKDSDGNPTGTDRDGHDMVLPNATVVSPVRPDNTTNHASYEVTIVAQVDVHPSYINHSENISIISNRGERGVIIQITNAGDTDIREIEYVVVFYSGDEVADVSWCEDVYDVGAGKTIYEEVSDYGVEYDSFEVYLNQAHTF